MQAYSDPYEPDNVTYSCEVNTCIVPPMAVSIICGGVSYARFMASDKVRLYYLDGTMKEARIPQKDRIEWPKSFFAIVRAVESKAST